MAETKGASANQPVRMGISYYIRFMCHAQNGFSRKTEKLLNCKKKYCPLPQTYFTAIVARLLVVPADVINTGT
jgi:hypothetical protein